MKRKLNLLFLSFFCVLLAMAAPGELKEKLQSLQGYSNFKYEGLLRTIKHLKLE